MVRWLAVEEQKKRKDAEKRWAREKTTARDDDGDDEGMEVCLGFRCPPWGRRAQGRRPRWMGILRSG